MGREKVTGGPLMGEEGGGLKTAAKGKCTLPLVRASPNTCAHAMAAQFVLRYKVDLAGLRTERGCDRIELGVGDRQNEDR